MPIEQREAVTIQRGDVVEVGGGILVRVDRIVQCREIVDGDTFRNDGKPAKVTIHGEVVTP